MFLMNFSLLSIVALRVDKSRLTLSSFPGEGEIARLDKTAYGTKQGARRFYDFSAETLIRSHWSINSNICATVVSIPIYVPLYILDSLFMAGVIRVLAFQMFLFVQLLRQRNDYEKNEWQKRQALETEFKEKESLSLIRSITMCEYLNFLLHHESASILIVPMLKHGNCV
jgi:hypothetical protein